MTTSVPVRSARTLAARTTPRRYQLNKEAYGVLVAGHPWIFRSHISSAASVLPDGQWLALFDGHNKLVGHGIYEADGAIAIRVLGLGDKRPRAAVWHARIDTAVAKRARLRGETNGIRLLHGECDGVPGVVIEALGDVVVAQSYTTGSDGLARLAAQRIATAIGAKTIISKPAHRRAAAPGAPRVLRGAGAPAVVRIREGDMHFAIDPLGGQKSGAFLDLRGLRRWLRSQPVAGASVLNLFAYTGMLGVAAEAAGAAHITHVDSSAPALAWGQAHHVVDGKRHVHVEADVFEWLPQQAATAAHAIVIVDPPNMTSRVEQVPRALAGYRKLYTQARGHVAPGGALVAACCTSRISRAQFRKTLAAALGEGFVLEHELAVEPDHHVAFAQADYLKILVWRRVDSSS